MIPRTILVPIDFSDGSRLALAEACTLAKQVGATIHLVSAIDVGLTELSVQLSGSVVEQLVMDSQAALTRLAEEHRDVTIGSALVRQGDAREVILDTAKAVGADMIVMGTHGRRGISRMMLGSVTEHVLRRAECPVLAVPTKRAA